MRVNKIMWILFWMRWFYKIRMSKMRIIYKARITNLETSFSLVVVPQGRCRFLWVPRRSRFWHSKQHRKGWRGPCKKEMGRSKELRTNQKYWPWTGCAKVGSAHASAKNSAALSPARKTHLGSAAKSTAMAIISRDEYLPDLIFLLRLLHFLLPT